MAQVWLYLSDRLEADDRQELQAHFDQCSECRNCLGLWRHALMCLKPEERDIFFLRQIDELKYERIAEIRNCPTATIRTQLRTAITKLRKVLSSASDLC